MPDISLFDVIGPAMVGPSSSHTAGACRMARTARTIFGEEPAFVRYRLYGSFADTYLGHGTDKALLGGAMGFEADDARIRDAPDIAQARGLAYVFEEDHVTDMGHPNTVDITLVNASGDHTLCVTAQSIGGGKIRVIRLDGVDVNFTGEFPTLIIHHMDVPGVISYFTGVLGDARVNIAGMRCYRGDDGRTAYSVVESDGLLDDQVIRDIKANRLILKTILIQSPSGR